MKSEYQLTLPPVQAESADSEIKQIFEQQKSSLGFIPNMYATMANAPLLLKSYLSSYAVFRQESLFSPVEQEVLFLTVSRFNGCEYCVSAHSVIADTMSGVPTEVTDAIRDDKPIADEKLAALTTFTRLMLSSRGLPAVDDVKAFLSAGYSEQHILEIIVAIAIKTMSNYSNHLFHTAVDDAFANRSWADHVTQRDQVTNA